MKSLVVVTGLVSLTACSSIKNYPARGFQSSPQPTETTSAQYATPAPQAQQGNPQVATQPTQGAAQGQPAQGGQAMQGQGAQPSKQATVATKSATAQTPTAQGVVAPVVTPPPAGLIVTSDPENRFQLWVPEGTRRESKRTGEKLWVVFSKEADITINVKRLAKREFSEAMAAKEAVGGTPEVVGDARLFTSVSEGIVSFDLFRDTYAVECYGPTEARVRLRQMCTSFQPSKK